MGPTTWRYNSEVRCMFSFCQTHIISNLSDKSDIELWPNKYRYSYFLFDGVHSYAISVV